MRVLRFQSEFLTPEQMTWWNITSNFLRKFPRVLSLSLCQSPFIYKVGMTSVPFEKRVVSGIYNSVLSLSENKPLSAWLPGLAWLIVSSFAFSTRDGLL